MVTGDVSLVNYYSCAKNNLKHKLIMFRHLIVSPLSLETMIRRLQQCLEEIQLTQKLMTILYVLKLIIITLISGIYNIPSLRKRASDRAKEASLSNI